MKNYILIFLIGMSNFASAQINKAEIVATGLTCSMCSKAIYKQLQKNPNIERVETDLNTNTYTIFFKRGNQIKPIELKENIEKAGFFVGSMVVYLPSESLRFNSNSNVEQGKTTFAFLEGNAKIGGEQTKVKILSKGYLTAKEYKKLTKVFAKSSSFFNVNADLYPVKIVE